MISSWCSIATQFLNFARKKERVPSITSITSHDFQKSRETYQKESAGILLYRFP